MREAWLRFMRGRYGEYGLDGFGWFLMIIGMVLSGAPFVWVVSPLVAGWEVWRLLSRNKASRSLENQHFKQILGTCTGWMSPVLLPVKRALGKGAVRLAGWGFKGALQGRKAVTDGKRMLNQNRMRFEERKVSVFVKCPHCRNMLRLPKGKGRLEATCPVCRTKFEQRT